MLEGGLRNGGDGGAGGIAAAAIGMIEENKKVSIDKFINRGKLIANGGNGGTGVPIVSGKCCDGLKAGFYKGGSYVSVSLPCELEEIVIKSGTGGKSGGAGLAGIFTSNRIMNFWETVAIGGNAGNGGKSKNVAAGNAAINAGSGVSIGIIAKCMPGSVAKLLNSGIHSSMISNVGTYGAQGVDLGNEGKSLNRNVDNSILRLKPIFTCKNIEKAYNYIHRKGTIFENKKLDTTSIAEEIIIIIAMQPLRIIYNFMLFRKFSALLVENIIDEK